ncbi:xanthine dehydrogenase family protein subunit M [Luteococcus peritonei]|uniref:Xanthine dehydrogenase family protein subunit M n=1 Tax=Luteococcus peritonei TaxID=88874 RepID=A0ABW4RX85_9ACTN
MKPAPFTYHAPRTIDETLTLLAELPEAKVMAGGQSFVPVLNMRLASPQHLIDINHVEGLDTVAVTDQGVTIGALVRHAELEHHDGAYAAIPLLRQAVSRVAHPAIRNRGTTVGSIAHADPSGEMPAILALCDGTLTARSVRGERTIKAADFFVGPMESTLEHDELVTHATFARFAPGTRTAYDELARRSGDYAVVGVAVAVTVEDDTITAARASFVSVTDAPDVLDLSGMLTGHPAIAPDEQTAAQLAQAVAEHVDPVDDIHASAEYRREVASILTRRVLTTALAHTPEGAHR